MRRIMIYYDKLKTGHEGSRNHIKCILRKLRKIETEKESKYLEYFNYIIEVVRK